MTGAPMSHVSCLWGKVRGVLYSEVQCIMGKGHMGIPPEQNGRQTPSRFVGSRSLKVGVCL